MPNRILRDWTDSEKINQLTVHAERFFIRLIMKVDDYGRFPANISLLKANLYPLLLNTIREADISRWITECANTTDADGEKSGLILIYQVKGKGYIQINDFRQRLDKAREKYPGPGDFKSDIDFPEIPGSSRLKRREGETETESESESETRGKEKKFHPPDFLEFKNYFLENGFDEDLATHAFEHYRIGDWRDTNGNKVVNWKQKVHSVWFKKENKKHGKHANSTDSEPKIGRIPISEAEAFMRTKFGIAD